MTPAFRNRLRCLQLRAAVRRFMRRLNQLGPTLAVTLTGYLLGVPLMASFGSTSPVYTVLQLTSWAMALGGVARLLYLITRP